MSGIVIEKIGKIVVVAFFLLFPINWEDCIFILPLVLVDL